MDSDRQNGSKRIDEIRKKQTELDLVAPPHFVIRDAKGKLHDRCLILFGNDITKVFVLSNSFDTMAENYASIAIPADEALSRDIFQYYLDLFSKTQLEDVYISKNVENKETLNLKSSKNISVKLPNEFNKNGKVYDITEAKNVLNIFLKEGRPALEQYYSFVCLETSAYLSQNKPLDYELLSDTFVWTNNIITYVNFARQFPLLHNAARTLIEKDVASFIDIINIIAENVPDTKNRDFRPGFLGTIMLYVLLKEYPFRLDEKDIVKAFFAAKSSPLRAIAVVHWTHPARHDISLQTALDIFKEHLSHEEFLSATIFLLHQILLYPKAFYSRTNGENAAANSKLLYPYISSALHNVLLEKNNLDTVERVQLQI